MSRHGFHNLSVRPDLVTSPLPVEPPAERAKLPLQIGLLH
jgi:hypothetical protein